MANVKRRWADGSVMRAGKRKRPAKRTRTRTDVKGFELLRESIAHPERFPDDFIAIPLDEEHFAAVFSRERIRLLRTLRDEGPFDSVGAVAEALERGPSRVSRDLASLEGLGLVFLMREGKKKRVRAADRPIVLF
jgi:DNA-binding transcriptional ArsR family regulator